MMAGWLSFSPLVLADQPTSQPTLTDPNAAAGPVIITEIATGTKISGSQEFVELYNTTDQPIDLAGWQLWYLAAQAADQNKPSASGVIALGDNASSSVIPAHGYYVLSGRTDYLPTIAQQFYTGTLAATGGNLRLLQPDGADPCLLDVQDQVGWGNALYAQGQPAAAPPSGQSLVRLSYTDSSYINMYNNAADFVVNPVASPGTDNEQQATSAMQSQAPVSAPASVTVPIDGCTPPAPPDSGAGEPLRQPGTNDAPPATITPSAPPASSSTADSPPTLPASDVGLVTPQITELLPNPAPPQTDMTDEFIELYNSNDMPFDLSGFMLQAGLTTKHTYRFPPATNLGPKSFTSFFSSQTGLSLSNGGGQVALLDPTGASTNQTRPYGVAKPGQGWALASGEWYWTLTPTPNAANVITATTTTAKATIGSAANKTTSKKASAAVKSNSVTKPKAAKSKPGNSSPVSVSPTSQPMPLHPILLAIVAGFALVYGLYEYRQDLANKLYQFRANRTARRAARAEPEGG